MLKVDLGAVNSKTVTVNADYWKKLPAEVQGVLQEVAVAYRDQVASVAMDRAAASRDAYVSQGGTVVDIDDSERAAWAEAIPNIAAEWATNLDKKGEPGSDMLKAYLGKLSAAGHAPLRDWAAGL